MKTYEVITPAGNAGQYVVDKFDVWRQLDPAPYDYDKEYIDIYNKPEYQKGAQRLSEIRLDFILVTLSEIRKMPFRILDYGCGNGAFLKHAKEAVYNSWYGFDVAGQNLEGVTMTNPGNGIWDVVTFWDVWEHLPDAEQTLIDLRFPEHLYFSLPNRPYNIEELATWKHTKPDEHLAHYNIDALKNELRYYGYSLQSWGHPEDEVRKPDGPRPNILTAKFTRI